MADGKVQTAVGVTVIEVTKHIMNMYQIDQEAAYKKLLNTDFYGLLNDLDTNLYLETNEYLCKACELELREGKDSFYAYINQE